MFKRLASSSASVKPVLEHRDSPASVMDQNLSLSLEHDKLKEKLRQHFLDSLGEAGSEDFSEQFESYMRSLNFGSMACIDFALSNKQNPGLEKERQALVALIERQILPDQSNAEKVDLELVVKNFFFIQQIEYYMGTLDEDQFKLLKIALENKNVEFLVGFVDKWIEFLYKENDIFINRIPQIDTYYEMEKTNSLPFQFIQSIEKLYKKYNPSGLKEYKGPTIGRSSVRKKAATWSATQMGTTQHTNFQSQESGTGFSGFPTQCDTKRKLSYCPDVKAESQNASPSNNFFQHLIAFMRGE